jgi:hypothetical protein
MSDQYSFPVADRETTLNLNNTASFTATESKFRSTNQSLSNTSSLPAWIAYDRKVAL